MHAVVMDSLEDYLSGLLEPAGQKAVEAHLDTCAGCREEVRGIRDVSQWLGSLRPEEAFAAEPSPGFYAAVLQKAERLRPAPSFAGLFAVDFAFGRRLVFASLVVLAILGSYLVTREVEFTGGWSPDAVMAQQESPAFDSASGTDNMLVTLTAYEQR